jgi:hypothetical protein
MGTGRTGTASVTAENIENVRVGEKAAKVYPWMTVIPLTLASAAANVGVPVRVSRTDPGSLGEAAFYNNMNRIVRLSEIRFMALPPPNSTWCVYDIVRKVGASIKHTNYDIARDFLPLYALATRNNFASPVYDGSMAFDLPSKYLTPKGNVFTMLARNVNTPAADGGILGISLNGSDHRGSPYILAREGNPAVTSTTFQFSENTGAGVVKDCLIDRVNFNISRNFSDPYASFLWGLQTEVQFVPPEGPKWHASNDWFPVNGIANQATVHVLDAAGTRDVMRHQDIVSYRPVTPHIITPRQQITIDLKCYQVMSHDIGQNTIFQVPMWITMLGTQESLAS